MEIQIKNNKGKDLKIGDEVTILTIFDDSGDAIDIYGVEPHLGGWIEILYIDKVTGTIQFDEELLMFVIKTKTRKYPLSREIRANYIYQNWERLDIKEIKNNGSLDEFKLEKLDEDSIIDYLI